MPILPHRRDGIRADRHDGLEAGLGRIRHIGREGRRIRTVAHFVVTPAALRAGTAGPQQREGIDAGLVIVPQDDQLFLFTVGIDGYRVHQLSMSCRGGADVSWRFSRRPALGVQHLQMLRLQGGLWIIRDHRQVILDGPARPLGVV